MLLSASCLMLAGNALGAAADPQRPAKPSASGAGVPYSVPAIEAPPASSDPTPSPSGDQPTDFPPLPAPPKFDQVGYAGFAMPSDARRLVGSDRRDAVTGALRGVAIASYVEVTALDSGKTILLLVTDNAAVAADRLINLSCGAVRQLGLHDGPAVPVRVRLVNPPAQEQGQLRAGGLAAERLPSPPGLLTALRGKLPAPPRGIIGNGCGSGSGTGALAPAQSQPVPQAPAITTQTAKPIKPNPQPAKVQPAKSPAAPVLPAVPVSSPDSVGPVASPVAPKSTPVPASPAAAVSHNRYVIQVGAYSDRDNAVGVVRTTGGIIVAGGGLFRVRTGPYADRASADRALRDLRAKGFPDAAIVTN